TITTSFSHPKQHHSGGKNGFCFSCMFLIAIGFECPESVNYGSNWIRRELGANVQCRFLFVKLQGHRHLNGMESNNTSNPGTCRFPGRISAFSVMKRNMLHSKARKGDSVRKKKKSSGEKRTLIKTTHSSREATGTSVTMSISTFAGHQKKQLLSIAKEPLRKSETTTSTNYVR
ncbi:unnamed protein product, partial [Nesidiocoris tenuis]